MLEADANAGADDQHDHCQVAVQLVTKGVQVQQVTCWALAASCGSHWACVSSQGLHHGVARLVVHQSGRQPDM